MQKKMPTEHCKSCPFPKDTKFVHTYVEGESIPPGLPRADALILAEAPAKDEHFTGCPLATTGTAGSRFRPQLQASGLDRYRIYIANVVMCTNLEEAPKARLGLKNHRPPKQAITACRPNWQRLVKELEPKILLLLGVTAVRAAGLAQPKETLKQMRQRINFGQPVFIGKTRVLVARHPSGLTFQKRGNAAWQHFASDFDRVRQMLEGKK